MTPDERLAWLRLARTERVGPVAFEQLVGQHGSAKAAMDALPDRLRSRGISAKIPTIADIERELARGEAIGARLLCSAESDFPYLLAALDPPPPVIWVRGRTDLFQSRAAAVIGARIASAAGQRFARGLASQLGQAGVVVVSGMARGIDGAAHEGALPTGTIAVLGGGVDDIYPSEHRPLYERLTVEGAVVSESPPGYTARAADFPRRNRLISGLSRAVVVVEAELRSGSLITARLAGEQGREVLAVPGSPLDPRAKGTNDLIRQGAQLCEGAEDVLRAIDGGQLGEGRRRPWTGPAPADAEVDTVRARIADLVSPTPVSRDELVRATGAPVSAVLAALTDLALERRVELLPGGMVVQA